MSQAFDWLIANLQNYQLDGGEGYYFDGGQTLFNESGNEAKGCR